MPTTPRDVEEALRPLAVGPEVKSVAWRAYYEATDEQDFMRRFQTIPLPELGRRALYRLRFGEQPELLPGRTTGEKILRHGLEALPFVTSAGATIAAGPVSLFGGPAVAGLGAIPGEALKQKLEEAWGLELPRTTKQTIAGLGRSGVEMAAGEMAGQVIVKPAIKAAAGFLGGPFRRAALRPENIAVKEASEELGLRLTPGQIAGQTPAGAIGRTLEFYGETSMFGRPAIEAARVQGRQRAVQAVDDTLRTLASPASAETTGRMAQDAFQVGNRIFHEHAGQLYGEVDRLARGAMVDMRPLKAEATRILREQMDLPGFYYPKLGKPGAATQGILEDLAGSPDEIPFEMAQRIRTKLLSISPQPNELVAKEAPGLAKHFSGLLTGRMEQSAANLSPDAKTAWEAARTFWREGHDVFERSLVQSLMERNPEALVKAIKPGAVSDVKAVKKAILSYAEAHGTPAEKLAAKESWNQFREHFVRSTLLRDPDAVGEEVMDLLSLKKRLTDMGRPVLATMFGDAQGATVLKNLDVLGEAFSRLRKEMPFIRTYQFVEVARAVNAVVTAGAATAAAYRKGPEAALMTAAVMEGLPAAIGKMMYSPLATRYFVDGMSAFVRAGAKKVPFLPEAAGAALTKGTQWTTDQLLMRAPEASGLLARAFLTALREYELSQRMAQLRTTRGHPTVTLAPLPVLEPPIPGPEDPYQ